MAIDAKNTKALFRTEIPEDWEVKELGEFLIENLDIPTKG